MVKAVLLSLLLLPTLVLGAVPTITRPVTDPRGMLTAQEMESVAQALVQLRAERQVQMAVLLVDTTNGQPIEDFAHEAFSAWKGGEAGRDNGLLLVVARGDRRSRLEVGYGLEPYLTDGEATTLLHAQGPLMREGRIADALRAIIAGVHEQAPEQGALSPPANSWPAGAVRAFFFAMLVTAFVVSLLLSRGLALGMKGLGIRVAAVMLVAMPPAVLLAVASSSQLTGVSILFGYGVMLAVFFGGWFACWRKQWGLGVILLGGTVFGSLLGVSLLDGSTDLGDLLLQAAIPSFIAVVGPGGLLLLVKGIRWISRHGSGSWSREGSVSWSSSSSSTSSTDWSSSSSSSSYDSSSSYSSSDSSSSFSSDSSSSSSDWSGGGGSSGGGGGSDSW
ncbi:YgcG family protein [Corallococcus sp. CA053C]|uniref:TPM domain-containing protein n=1 Tax=Corallococcus sp. CA053C TaxID=2316732 RepID=UPI0013155D9C|nr:TPM domain-containing protein [Corallococcus sp. CA053C]